jgi:tetratricopeptide (TPR) repeat protein
MYFSRHLRTAVIWLLVGLTCATAWTLPKPADNLETWVEVRTPHFTVASNDGEKTARRVADQFEQIRFLYSKALTSNVRLDPSVPLLIFAVKNEKSLSQLLPEYWAQQGHLHPAGLFVPGPEKNYIALRTDVEGEFPYHTIYHEYVHLIVSLNFRHFPRWLNEGYAEFLGYASVTGYGGKLGQLSSAQLYVLSQNKLIPLDVLFKVDEKSPYYNEANKGTIFYAESWALVHYLMLDPEKQKAKVMAKYLTLIESGVDPLEAAQQAFGDLAQLRKELDAYTRKSTLMELAVPLPSAQETRSFPARTISAAEAEAWLGDFDMYRGQLAAAGRKLEDAIRLDPNLPAAQESMGYLLFRQQKREEADKYFARAIKLDSKSAFAYYFHAMVEISQATGGKPEEDAVRSLEKAVALNPDLAPAWANLGTLYSLDKDALGKALAAAQRATALVPGDPQFQYGLAVVLARAARFDDARKLAVSLSSSADPAIASLSQQLLDQLDQARASAAVRGGEANTDSAPATRRLQTGPGAAAENDPSVQPANSARDETSAPITPRLERRKDREENESVANSAAQESIEGSGPATPAAPVGKRLYSMVGTISQVECTAFPQLLLKLEAGTIAMRLHAADFKMVAFKPSAATVPSSKVACGSLQGRRARVSYQLDSQKSWDGEIQSVEFVNQP